MAFFSITGFLSAQGQPQGQAPQYANPIQQTGGTNSVVPPRTRIACINLQSVIKQYQKWSDFEKEYKSRYEAYNQVFEGKKKTAADLKAQFEKPGNDDQTREAIQRQMRALDREVQDLSEQAKKELGKMRDAQATQIYQEVEAAVQAYARANDIEMVLHFNDAIVKEDLYNPINIQSKLQTRALFPMYVADGMDITATIAAMLNHHMNAAAQSPGQR
jgi:Skp family chaperone for outer membrane proteins